MCCRNAPLWEGASAKWVGEINALFCATDTIAIGAIQYCRSQGLRVPEDVMVASVGDSRVGRVAYVPLTSAHLHYRTAGDKAPACCWTSCSPTRRTLSCPSSLPSPPRKSLAATRSWARSSA